MHNLNAKIGRRLRLGALGLLASALLGLSACAIKESGTDPADGSGIVVSVTDSTKVSLDFDNLAKTVFTESSEFSLDTLRKKLEDKSIDINTIKIIGLVVTYDAETKQFLTDNQGIRFVMRIYTNAVTDTGRGKLTLETYVDPAKASKLDPNQVLFELNKHLFGKEEGMPFLLGAIQDRTMSKVRVTAELTLLDPLKKVGKLNLNMVVDVAGKV